ncbi:MAG: glycosyltransferase family A protein [Candidatus Methylacidiphilales bacterium]|nr:glycosyltransferase family A protein [Candidatus Methylacidiphilales bacterium]
MPPSHTTTPLVQVYVPTFRRPHLLQRALDSLRAQTFTQWAAEVHNDDPSDPLPSRIVSELGDPRIRMDVHPRNLGGTATFNLFFQGSPAPFYSMLEDDNWWEPDFLRSMLDAAEAHPEVVVFWANMRIWKEEVEGAFTDTGTTTWPIEDGSGPHSLMSWGRPLQSIGALHSQSALLLRSRPGDDWRTPDVPIAVVEVFRERMFPHPLVLVNTPKAHFSLTRTTARSFDRAEWAEMQAMLAATFVRQSVKRFPRQTETLEHLWAWAVSQKPPCTAPLLLAALYTPAAFFFWHRESPLRLARLLVTLFLRPRLLWRLVRSPSAHRDWWDFLDHHTAARFAESSRL